MPDSTKPKKGGRPPKYPWRTIDVGESFYIKGSKRKNISEYARQRYKPLRFKCKKMPIEEFILVKVTRVL